MNRLLKLIASFFYFIQFGIFFLSIPAYSQIEEGYLTPPFMTSNGGWCNKVFDTGNKSICLVSMSDSGTVLVTKLDSLNNIFFDRRYSGTGYVVINDVAITNDSGIIIASYDESDTNHTGFLTLSGQVHKMDKYGNLDWAFEYFSGDENRMNACMQQNDSTYIFAGQYLHANYQYPYMVKTDVFGNILSTKYYNTMSKVVGLVSCNDGGYAMLTYDACMLWRYDANDQILWKSIFKFLPGYYYIFKKLIYTSDGGFAVCGAILNNQTNYWDALIAKLDSNGIMQWNVAVDAELGDGFMSLTETADSGFVAVGGTDFTGFGTSYGLLSKFNKHGQMVWSHVNLFNRILYSVTEADDGRLLVAGETRSTGSVYKTRYFAKINQDGHNCTNSNDVVFIWVPDFVTSEISNPLQEITISSTRLDNGSELDRSFSYHQICSTLTNDISQIDDGDFILWPNPASDEINIETSGIFNFKDIIIYDVLGNLLFEIHLDIGVSNYLIDVSDFFPAIYIVKVSNENMELFRRFIKE
jgi:hypothetical protein